MNDPRHAGPPVGSPAKNSAPMAQTPRPAAGAHQPAPAGDLIELDALELIEDGPAPVSKDDTGVAQAAVTPKKITFGPEIAQRQTNWKRKTTADGTGSVRVRSFHGKLSEQGLEYMDHYINEWLDQHPEIEIKFVTSSIGQFDGKMKEPAVILQVWY